MNTRFERRIKPAFSVIGLEGSTREGQGFIQALWQKANGRFAEVSSLACRNETGELLGIWGAMTDFSRSFQPWEGNFSQGLYLAGVECPKTAQPPQGWTKWDIPGYEFLCVPADTVSFGAALAHLKEQGLSLAGAAHDFTCPQTGKGWLYLPIRRLAD